MAATVRFSPCSDMVWDMKIKHLNHFIKNKTNNPCTKLYLIRIDFHYLIVILQKLNNNFYVRVEVFNRDDSHDICCIFLIRILTILIRKHQTCISFLNLLKWMIHWVFDNHKLYSLFFSGDKNQWPALLYSKM